MPFKDSKRHLREILGSIDQIEKFIGDMNFAAYLEDEKTKAAVIRLEMDGAEAYPDIDWKAYRGMGNFLRHSYHRVSDEIVWNTVQDDLPLLKLIVDKALRP